MANKITFENSLTQKFYELLVLELDTVEHPQELAEAILVALKTTLELHVTDDEWEVEIHSEVIDE